VFNNFAKKLAENGNKAWVITNQIIGEKYEENENIRLVFVPPQLEHKGGLPAGLLDNLRYVFNSVKVGKNIVKKENIDLIHSNNFAPALAGSIISSLTSKPHITTVHDIFSLCGKDFWKMWSKQNNVSSLYSIIGPFAEKILLKLNIAAIHTISEASRDDLIQFGVKKKTYVIPPTIEKISKIDTEVNPLQFVYVGRLVFYKNVEVLIQAIKIAKKEEPKIKLVIVGDGPHRLSLENLAKKLGVTSNVIFKGYVTQKVRNELIASSNALAFPSLCEGFGLVILEAFSQDKPVLVSNVRPMSDMISHKKTGLILDPHSGQEWADAMLELSKKPDEATHMGIAGKELLEKEHSLDKMYEKIIRMYNEIISK